MAEAGYSVASDSETNTHEDERPPLVFPELAIGIDIGTSQCSVAVWTGSEVELINNTRSQRAARSHATFKDAAAALSSGAHEHEKLSGAAIFNMKRLVGRADTDPVVVQSSRGLPFLVQALGIGSRPFVAALSRGAWRSTTPEEVLAITLVEARAAAEAGLGRGAHEAVVVVPAAFTRLQTTRVRRACAMAGLRALRLVPEPTAAALLYAQQQPRDYERLALVFNMGAGYADVAVSSAAGGISQIRSLAGAVVGGEDLLQNTMRFLAGPLFSDRGVSEIQAMRLLRLATQDAIHELSTHTEVMINVDLGERSRIQRVLERREFEEVNHEVFEKCSALISRCLTGAKCRAEDLDDVILVGGCSEIPRVRQLVAEACKKVEFYTRINPFTAAVSGAAIEAALASGASDPFGILDLLTIQVTPHAIGVRANGGRFVPVVVRNTTIPARREAAFGTAHDGQTEALVEVVEGGNEDDDEQNLIGYFKVIGIPPGPRGAHVITVCVDVDASNALTVFAGVVGVASSFMEVRMPTVDDGYAWCAEALRRTYGSSLDMVSVNSKKK